MGKLKWISNMIYNQKIGMIPMVFQKGKVKWDVSGILTHCCFMDGNGQWDIMGQINQLLGNQT